MKTYSNFVQFAGDFPTTEQCLSFLHELKWLNGYECRKCGHDVSVKGRTSYYKKCQKCQYDESCTAHTMFHKLKFPIVKAFWITYQLATVRQGIPSIEIARQYDINPETASHFKQKVLESLLLNELPFNIYERELTR